MFYDCARMLTEKWKECSWNWPTVPNAVQALGSPCASTDPQFPVQSSKYRKYYRKDETGGTMEHLLAGIWHLAAHSPEVLEAIADSMDVGHSHEHDLTIGVVLCRQEKSGA